MQTEVYKKAVFLQLPSIFPHMVAKKAVPLQRTIARTFI